MGSFASLTSVPLRPAPRPAFAGSLSLRSRPLLAGSAPAPALRFARLGFASLGGGALRVYPCIFYKERAPLTRPRTLRPCAHSLAFACGQSRKLAGFARSNSALHPPALARSRAQKAHRCAVRASALPLRHNDRKKPLDTPKLRAYILDTFTTKKTP